MANGANPRAFPNNGQNAPGHHGGRGAASCPGLSRSRPNRLYRVEFFATPAGGVPYQGKTYLGFFNVMTTGSGVGRFARSFAIPADKTW